MKNQMHPQTSSAMPTSLAGVNSKTPQKKTSIGQKKPLEALGTSPPPSRLKLIALCLLKAKFIHRYKSFFDFS